MGSTSGDDAGRTRIGVRAFCALLLVILIHVTSAPPTNAQEPAETDPEKCAAINLAHNYFACAHVNLLRAELIEGLKNVTEAERQEAADARSLVKDFLSVAAGLCKVAGKELTADMITTRIHKYKEEANEAFQAYLLRMKDEATGKKWSNIDLTVEACARSQLGEEIRSSTRINVRYLEYVETAKALLSKQRSCVVTSFRPL